MCVCGTSAVSAYVSMRHPGESNKRWRSEQPAAEPLTEHAYRHPSSCPALCHASQEDADGFTLDPALSPLFLRLFSALPPPSVCHLLHPSKFLPLILPHVQLDFTLLPQPLHLLCHSCLCCLVQEFDCQDLQESAGKKVFSRKSDPHLLIQSVHLLLKHQSSSYSVGILSLGTEVTEKANNLWHTTDTWWHLSATTPQL